MEIRQLNSRAVVIWKNVGETPLEALERFRAHKIMQGVPDFSSIPMTYAGRLDPMADGELLVLVGEECKQKERYLKLDKEYEVEVVFGIETDSHDALGIAKQASGEACQVFDNLPKKIASYTFPMVIEQTYPAYSSKTVDGRQLHELARSNELPQELPTREVTIYSVELLDWGTITAVDLLQRIESDISRVTGDFRQEEIIKKWRAILQAPVSGSLSSGQKFEMVKIRVRCSSGTYMRSLAHGWGEEMGTGAFALHIRRTHIIDRVQK